MKKEIKGLIVIDLFLFGCLIIGLLIARPLIVLNYGIKGFWQFFWLIGLMSVVVFSVSVYFAWRKQRKGPNIPEVDERTFTNIKEGLVYAYVAMLLISSVATLVLVLSGIKTIETTWLVVYMLPMWLLFFVAFLIGKSH